MFLGIFSLNQMTLAQDTGGAGTLKASHVFLDKNIVPKEPFDLRQRNLSGSFPGTGGATFVMAMTVVSRLFVLTAGSLHEPLTVASATEVVFLTLRLLGPP